MVCTPQRITPVSEHVLFMRMRGSEPIRTVICMLFSADLLHDFLSGSAGLRKHAHRHRNSVRYGIQYPCPVHILHTKTWAARVLCIFPAFVSRKTSNTLRANVKHPFDRPGATSAPRAQALVCAFTRLFFAPFFFWIFFLENGSSNKLLNRGS